MNPRPEDELSDVKTKSRPEDEVSDAEETTWEEGLRRGQRRPEDNTQFRARRTLPEPVADALLQAHLATGGSYRQVARVLGLDVAMWWRMTRGERVPSRSVAERVITGLALDDDAADALRDLAVERRTAATG